MSQRRVPTLFLLLSCVQLKVKARTVRTIKRLKDQEVVEVDMDTKKRRIIVMKHRGSLQHPPKSACQPRGSDEASRHRFRYDAPVCQTQRFGGEA